MSLFFFIPVARQVLALSVDDTTLTGNDSGASETGFVTSNVGTVSVVSGGIGPYTYAWTINDDAADSGPYNPVLQTGPATAFNATVSSLDVNKTENWICTVTDTGNSNNTATIGVSVTLIWTDIT